MAKPSKLHLNCQIVNAEPDPRHAGRTIVSVKFDDGDPAGPWIQGFSVVASEVVSVDDFINKLSDFKIQRPVDPLLSIVEAVNNKHKFKLDLTVKPEAPESEAS